MDRERYARHVLPHARLLVYILSRSVSQPLPLTSAITECVHVFTLWYYYYYYFSPLRSDMRHMDALERLPAVDQTISLCTTQQFAQCRKIYMHAYVRICCIIICNQVLIHTLESFRRKYVNIFLCDIRYTFIFRAYLNFSKFPLVLLWLIIVEGVSARGDLSNCTFCKINGDGHTVY